MTSGLNYYTEMLKASREDRNVCVWVNDYKPGDGVNVINMTGSFHNLNPGEQFILTQVAWGILSLNDSAHFAAGFTDEWYGSGSFTPIHHHHEMTVGGAKEYKTMSDETLYPPMIMKYSDGVKTVCIQADCGDADVEVTVAICGWVEPECA